jgi:type I restriction enzyme S subunit
VSFRKYESYQETGIDWLGRIPRHWTLPPLYLRYEVLLGKMLDTKTITGQNLIPYVRNVDVQWDQVNISGLPKFDVAPAEMERFSLRKGDLLVCEGGEVGRTGQWRGEVEPGGFQKAIHRLRPLDTSEEPRFFLYSMRFATATGIFIADGNPNARGQFKEMDDVSRSLSADRRRSAKRTVKSGYGDQGDRAKKR